MNETSHRLAGPEVRHHTITGLETNLYFNALVPRPVSEDWKPILTCELGRHRADRWQFRPESGQEGRHPFSLRLRDPRDGRVLTCSSEIHVHDRAPGKPGQPLRWLPVGDSLTAAGGYVEMVEQEAARLGGQVLSCGTRLTSGTLPARHEGYPGWKFLDFLRRRTGAEGANFREEIEPPFLAPGPDGPQWNFPTYCANHLEGQEPDMMTVFLGPNDIALLDEETLEEGLNEVMRHAETLLTALLDGTTHCVLGLIPPLPPSASQDAFGLDYGCLIPRWRYRRAQHALVLALQDRFRHFHPRLSLVPAFLQIDPETGYPARTEPIHAFTSETRTVASNSMHPSPAGHAQIAGAILAWMAGQRVLSFKD